MHITDDERIFAYRAPRFARNEKLNLIGFDQDAYAFYLFNGLPENSFDRMGHGTGTANDATVRALVYHIAGHELHHFNVIKERYLP